jgi:hypothetical protein
MYFVRLRKKKQKFVLAGSLKIVELAALRFKLTKKKK